MTPGNHTDPHLAAPELDPYREVWFVTFDFDRPPGERPSPSLLRAREVRSGRLLRLPPDELTRPEPPYPLGHDVLFVTYDAPAQLGCHLTLGWPLPAKVLDLQAEFRWLTTDLDVPDQDLPGALAYFQLTGDGPAALPSLLEAMLPRLDLPRAVLRGRYAAAVARMEDVGIPIDMASFARLRGGWEQVKDALIEQVDQHYGVYDEGKLDPRRWRTWVNRQRIRWPRSDDRSGNLKLDLDTFKGVAKAYPAVRPMAELRATLAMLGGGKLAVGPDGRNRCPLRPFAAKTGRNAPSTAKFVFGLATWLRGLIKPPEGMALAYVDYEQQEFGIAAALSGDVNMQQAYGGGDPYLAFAKQAGAVPADATKETHREERERFKLCALGVQYGM